MAFVNYNNKEITVKIVYYGPALSGKTTCLQYTYSSKEYKKKGKLITLDTDGDRTLFFDFLPIEIGKLGDYSIKMQLYTVPGQVAYDTTRKLVLQGSDGIVFVADSQVVMREQNVSSFNNLKDNLKANNIPFAETPLIFQYNKRDLRDILSLETLNKDLNPTNKPFFPTIAVSGENVLEGLTTIMKMVILHLKNKLTIFQKDKTVMFSREDIGDNVATQKKLDAARREPQEPQDSQPMNQTQIREKLPSHPPATSDIFNEDTGKEELFELSNPVEDESLVTQMRPQQTKTIVKPQPVKPEPEEDIFNLSDDSMMDQHAEPPSQAPIDMDFEVPDVVMQDELADVSPVSQQPSRKPITMPDYEPETLEYDSGEPMELSPDDQLDISYEDQVQAPEPEPIPIPAPKPQPPKAQTRVSAETIPFPPISREKEITPKPVEIVINPEKNGVSRKPMESVDVPLTVQVPADKDEITININLKIVIKKN